MRKPLYLVAALLLAACSQGPSALDRTGRGVPHVAAEADSVQSPIVSLVVFGSDHIPLFGLSVIDAGHVIRTDAHGTTIYAIKADGNVEKAQQPPMSYKTFQKLFDASKVHLAATAEEGGEPESLPKDLPGANIRGDQPLTRIQM